MTTVETTPGAGTPPWQPTFHDARRLVAPALRRAVDRLDPTMRRVCGYHLGWLAPDGSARPAWGGKGVRPTLTLLAASACGGDPSRAIPAAVAVDLVHNFSLVHDDIMDGDAQRRRRVTVWAQFGVPVGVLAGDALLALAVDVLLTEAPPATAAILARGLVHAVGELVAGQSADLDFETRTDVTLAEGIAMSEAKTSALLACAASSGAISVGAPSRQVEAMAAFGHHLGNAFQTVDDLLGIWGDPATTGKPALADLRSRKKSLPVLAAFGSSTAAGAALQERYADPAPLQDGDLTQLADLVEQAGGRAWAEGRARREIAEARRCVRAMDMPEPVERALLDLADFVVGRDR